MKHFEAVIGNNTAPVDCRPGIAGLAGRAK
jgi:hypothetical protein